jgi:DNA-binding PadR family transcriptional regulator
VEALEPATHSGARGEPRAERRVADENERTRRIEVAQEVVEVAPLEGGETALVVLTDEGGEHSHSIGKKLPIVYIVGRVSLRHAILAVLLDGPASGYDLAKRFDRSVANFWHATRQQIYAELERMQSASLVQAEVRHQQSRPDKHVFHVTDLARREIDEWIPLHSAPTAIKDEMLVRVQAAGAAQSPALLETLAVWRAERAVRLEQYARLRERLLAGRAETEYLSSVDRPGGYLTLLRGTAFERENLAWADYVSAVLRLRLGHGSR